MGPNFEIYVSLLTGSWMPWLDRNRGKAEFDHLLEALWPHTGVQRENFSVRWPFFWWVRRGRSQRNSWMRWSILPDSGLMQDRRWLLNFCACLHPAPANSFTMYLQVSVCGYDSWIGKLVQPGQDTHLRVYFRERLLHILFNLIHQPVAVPEAFPGELEVAFRAKAALCILCHRLQGRQALRWHYMPRVFRVRELLHDKLSKSQLSEASRLQIMHLFDALTGEKPPLQLTSAAPLQNIPAVPSPEDNDPEMAKLTHLVKESSSEIQQLKQVLEWFLANGNAPASKTAPKDNHRLDSSKVLRMLSVTKTSLQRYRDEGSLPFAKVGKKYTYLEADVLKLIEEGKKIKKSGNGRFRKPEK